MTSHFYARNYTGWPPVANRDIANPISRHWEQQARAAKVRLIELLGADDYATWAEITWPADKPGSSSWKAAFDEIQYALDHPNGTIQQFECNCNPAGIGARCRVCNANSRIREREEQSQ